MQPFLVYVRETLGRLRIFRAGVSRGKGKELFPRPPTESFLNHHPQISCRVPLKTIDIPARQTIFGREGGEDSIPVAYQPAAIRRADPEIALPILIEHREPAGADARRVALVEDRKAHAVVARQSVRSGQPEVAVASLENVLNRVVPEPRVGRPVVEVVLP